WKVVSKFTSLKQKLFTTGDAKENKMEGDAKSEESTISTKDKTTDNDETKDDINQNKMKYINEFQLNFDDRGKPYPNQLVKIIPNQTKHQCPYCSGKIASLKVLDFHMWKFKSLSHYKGKNCVLVQHQHAWVIITHLQRNFPDVNWQQIHDMIEQKNWDAIQEQKIEINDDIKIVNSIRPTVPQLHTYINPLDNANPHSNMTIAAPKVKKRRLSIDNNMPVSINKITQYMSDFMQ
ncbi:hypothetical protein RFI_31766, partial [Reticulomyxa filosa]